MPDQINLDRIQNTPEIVDYSVGVADGRTFRLAFTREILDIWTEQLSRSGRTLELDPIANGLAREIASQEPNEAELGDGFLVTTHNGFATPTATEQNLKNSGVLPFLASREGLDASPPPAMPAAPRGSKEVESKGNRTGEEEARQNRENDHPA